MTSSDDRVDIGELGLRGASAVVEQMLRITQQLSGVKWPVTLFGTPEDTEGPLPTALAGGATSNGHGTERSAELRTSRTGDVRALRADADRLIELYGEWTRSLLDGLTTLAEGEAEPATDRIEIGPVEAGGVAEAIAYLHLFEGALTRAPAFHATDLTAHHRGTIAGGQVTVGRHPDADDPPGGARMTIAVVVDVPKGTPPATYHGYVLLEDLAEVLLPICVLVVT